jgi:hypothetical protein
LLCNILVRMGKGKNIGHYLGDDRATSGR